MGRTPLGFAAVAVSVCATLALACTSAPAAKEKPATTEVSNATSILITDGEVNPRLLRRFQPLPAPVDSGKTELADLGRWLYFEKRLSQSNDVSCNTCHALADYGVDHHRTSTGVGGNVGDRNSPTVYNAAGHFAQFWDGRAPDVEEQAKGPILNPKEMAMPDGAAVVARLSSFPEYRERFARAFPESKEPITFDNVGKALGAFERGLITPGRWDEFLRGKKDALSFDERRGLKTFLNSGCMVCHTGPYLGGSTFERVGVVEPWPNQKDLGRAAVTKAPGDRMMFKVPSLRNVEKTAPYFHDGSAATLEDAVRMMGRHQLGLDLAPEEIGAIVTWLKSLTSPLPPAGYIADPSERSTANEAPPLPLKQWMSANVRPAMRATNYDQLARVLERVSSFEPNDPRFSTWKSIAKSGAAAASNRDIEGVREACRSCHDAHRATYRIWASGRQ